MHNFREHLGISALVSSGTYFAMCRYYDRNPNLGELLVCAGIGIGAGAAPDFFEPATDPHHRALGNSMALGTALTKFAITHSSRENGNWDEFLKIVVAVACVAYLAHLIGDALTPNSLPVLGH